MARMETVGAAITANSRRASGIAGNMSASDANAASGFESFVKATVMPDGQGGYRYGSVKVETKQSISRPGEIVGSNISTHIAIKGEGFIPVSRKGTEEILLTRLGTFDIASNGDLLNEEKMTLMGWKLDDEGRLPGENGNSNTKASAELTSLEAVNIKSLSGKVKATSSIALDMRLDSQTDVIMGAGQTFKFLDSGVNKDLGVNDVIVPSSDGIALQDEIRVKVADGNEETYLYGGVSSTFNIKKTPMLGVNEPSKTFLSANAADATHAVLNDKLRITVGSNASVDLVFANGASSNNNTFNSLTSLCTVLNNVPGLTARIESNTLYIASMDGVSQVAFADIGSSDFKNKLGLVDIAAAPNGVKRFSTMGQLQKQLDANPDLRITKNPDGGLSINALDPTAPILFTGNSQRSVPINFVSATQPGAVGTERDNRKITIMSPQNGLKTGDFVKLAGLDTTDIAGANITADGLYLVLSADEAGFTIAANATVNVQAAVAGGAAVAGTTYRTSVPADATWTKMPGKAEAAITVGAGGGHTIESTVANVVVIDGGAGAFPNAGANAIAAGDMVYISGIGLDNTITVPDGYYEVTANDGQHLTINVQGAAGGVVAAATTKAYTVQKVGTGAANVMTGSVSLEQQGAPRDKIVRVYMPDHGFSQDDYFSFVGSAINGVATGTNYKIASTGPGYFEFETEAVVAGNLNGRSLGADNFINCFGKLDQAIGFRQDKDGLALDSAFSPEPGKDSNLSVKKFDGVFEQVLTVYDSLGAAHSFNIAFAKIGQNKWAVQMFTHEDKLIENAVDGIVGSATIEFDGNGVLKSIEGLDKVLIKWKNGAAATELKFNMGATADDESTAVFTTGGVKQLAGSSQLFSVENDGYGVGRFVSVNVDSTTGRIIATYDNGQTMPIYMLPLCFVAAPDELEAAGGNAYRTTNTSGAIILKRTGDDGVGSYEGQAIEKSNIDTTEQMSGLAQVAQQSAMQASVFQMLKQMNDEFVRRT